jgi:predicted RNase H-like HicB family nuclease
MSRCRRVERKIRTMTILAEYIDASMKEARTEKLEDGQYFCSLPQFRGVWAAAATKHKAMEELRDVFEEWLVAALRDDDDLPEVGGLSLNFAGKRWRNQSPEESLSRDSGA